MITILEEWKVVNLEEWMVVDKWWEPQPIRSYYAEVLWNGRIIIFKKTVPDKVWRIVSVTRTPTSPTRGSDPAA